MQKLKVKKRNNTDTFYILQFIWMLIQKKRRFQFLLLLLVMIISSIAELCTLASVVPFLKIIVDPESIFNIKIIKYLSENYFPVTDSSELLLPITLTFGLSAILSSFIRLITIYFNQTLSAKIGSDISSLCYSKILERNFLQHSQSNSSFTLKVIINQIDFTVIVINFFLELIASSLITLTVVATLFLANWKVALIAVLFTSISYFQISKNSKKRLTNNSKTISNSLNLQIKNIQETLGSFREVILHNLQKQIVSKYEEIDIKRRLRLAENQSIAKFPKYILEGLGLMMVAIFSYFLIRNSNQTSNFISTIGLLTLGAQRLLPAAQQIYNSWTSIKANSAAVLDIKKVLDINVEPSKIIKNNLYFKKNIKLKDVSFKYNDKESNVLENINLVINKGSCIGIKGTTGSGKSTLFDIILGLLQPTKGRVFVDDIDIRSNIYYWRSMLAHVPQEIYLLDDTISQNIAFGVEKNKIDFNRIETVAKMSYVSEFVNKYPKKYETFVGEKGISLSGGQIQRIGIARALYLQKKILILDEATSALDRDTEKRVIDSILSYSNQVTIFTIAHRLETLKYCDSIITIENGQIKNEV